MNPLLRHHPRCVYLGTLVGNFILSLFVTVVVSVQTTKHHMQRAPRPEFLPVQNNITVREGGVAILPCSVRYLGTKQIVWRRIESDKFLTIGKLTWVANDHISLEYSKLQGQVSNFNLVIKHVTADDHGIYECQITSRKGHIRHVRLNVVGPPISKPDSSVLSRVSSTHPLPVNIPHLPVIVCPEADDTGCLISITGRKFVDLGEKIELKCNASSGARVADEIDWFKAGDKIDGDKYSHISISKFQFSNTRSFVSILTIKHSRLTDTGDYICRSSRNDIASLKVTVLHGESEKERRGTENGRTQGSYQVEGGDGNGSSCHLSPTNSLVVYLFCAYVTAIHLIGCSTLQL